LSYK